MAISTWFHVRMDLPIVPISNQWTCPFPQPNGADDWADFSPFSPTVLTLPGKITTHDFRWDNGRTWASGVRIEVPTMARISGNNGFYDTGGMGNRAVIQAIYAVFLNRHTPLSGMSIDPRGSLLVNDIVPAMYSDTIMTSVINQVRKATGISDGGDGSIEQLAAGLQAGSGYYLSCAPGGLFGAGSSQIYTSISFMPNIDISGFSDLLLDGTIMILQTNKLVWNSSRKAWGYGEDGLYLVKSISRQSSFTLFGLSYSDTYTLYDVANGTTKVVTPGSRSIKNIWSTGSVSAPHTVTILDDGSDYAEVVLGFAGMDPLVNHY
ncbi:MAG TPA: hypothetical protein VHL14_02170 [Steroidobacteraceae bacterium]|nr:hypothetical protein [Steroidobacteraceae bacterium]